MAADGWRRKFEPPIVTPEGTTLRTLRDAIKYLAATISAKERDMPQITTAAEMLTRAAEASEAWMYFAKIAVGQRFAGMDSACLTPIAKIIIGESGS